jgi:hypothetical protein
MKPGRRLFRYLSAFAAIATVLTGQTIVRADVEANPSFSNTMELFTLTPSAQFGTLRQYQPAAPINVTIYNYLPQGGPPQSAMTYDPSQTTSLPTLPAITLQNIALNAIPAGGQGSLQLALSTNQSGSNVAANYHIYFTSDTGPAPDHGLSIFAFSIVLPAGDYNNDKSVDPRDYVLWRKTSLSPSVTPWTLGDSNGDGFVNDFDYARYRENFGVALPASSPSLDSSSSLESVGVPEPASALLAFLGLGAAHIMMGTRSRRRRSLR